MDNDFGYPNGNSPILEWEGISLVGLYTEFNDNVARVADIPSERVSLAFNQTVIREGITLEELVWPPNQIPSYSFEGFQTQQQFLAAAESVSQDDINIFLELCAANQFPIFVENFAGGQPPTFDAEQRPNLEELIVFEAWWLQSPEGVNLISELFGLNEEIRLDYQSIPGSVGWILFDEVRDKIEAFQSSIDEFLTQLGLSPEDLTRLLTFIAVVLAIYLIVTNSGLILSALNALYQHLQNLISAFVTLMARKKKPSGKNQEDEEMEEDSEADHTPESNITQNEQSNRIIDEVEDEVREELEDDDFEGLNIRQRRQIHDEITGHNYSEEDIRNIVRDRLRTTRRYFNHPNRPQ